MSTFPSTPVHSSFTVARAAADPAVTRSATSSGIEHESASPAALPLGTNTAMGRQRTATQVHAIPIRPVRRSRLRRYRTVLTMALALTSAAVPAMEVEALEAGYVAAVQRQIQLHWLRPDGVAQLDCVLTVTQASGGEVIEARFDTPCDADKATQASLKAAAMRASPLPYAGYERVFRHQLQLHFQHDG